MRPVKKIDILRTPKTASQALNYLFEGFKYFMMEHLFKTLIFLIVFCGAPGYVLINYYFSSKTAQVTEDTSGTDKATETEGPPRHSFHLRAGSDSLLVKDNATGKKYVVTSEALKEIGK